MKSLLILTVLLLLLSCSKNITGKKANGCSDTCQKNVVCTASFAFSKLKIKYSDGSVYKLDSFKTVRSQDGKMLDPNIQYNEPGLIDLGEYPVFNDNFISLTDQCGKEFLFIGYKDNMEVVKEKFIFSHDCCHMQRLSGKTELIK